MGMMVKIEITMVCNDDVGSHDNNDDDGGDDHSDNDGDDDDGDNSHGINYSSGNGMNTLVFLTYHHHSITVSSLRCQSCQ